ncbi:hypothetical protein ACFYY3_01070 [Streptomyces sp. NPDC001812]|uniref:hypothetical protein n=1 Tax=Streptomyces sp. NPDC001812 TaxID=3364611 RepID=UPI00369F88AB
MATNDLTEAEIGGPIGYIALCLAHIRAGHPITELDIPHVIYVAPTQTEVDQARYMAQQLAHRCPDGTRTT